jgi:hypothetical protein
MGKEARVEAVMTDGNERVSGSFFIFYPGPGR